MCPLTTSATAKGSLSRLRRVSIQPKLAGDGLQGFDAETDVLIQIDAQSSGAVDNVVAVHLAGEGLIFHSFSHRLGVDFGQRLPRLDQGDGGDESGEFVAGEQSLLHGRVAGDASV